MCVICCQGKFAQPCRHLHLLSCGYPYLLGDSCNLRISEFIDPLYTYVPILISYQYFNRSGPNLDFIAQQHHLMQSVPVPSAGSPPLPSSGTPAQPPPLPGSKIFEDALSDFKKGLSKRELAQFQFVDFKDVDETIKDIERNQKMKKKMQNIARIKPFLECVRQYGKIIEVFLNTSTIVAYIWVSSQTVVITIRICY